MRNELDYEKRGEERVGMGLVGSRNRLMLSSHSSDSYLYSYDVLALVYWYCATQVEGPRHAKRQKFSILQHHEVQGATKRKSHRPSNGDQHLKMAPLSILKGKRALVTGASGKIGQAIANKLAQAGASVVLTGRNLKRLDEAAAKIKNNLAADNRDTSDIPALETFPCDVTDESSVKELFARIQESDGKQIDILVNNAGTNVDKPLSELTGSDFEWVMKVNVLGPFLCSREAFKNMPTGGRIINIGSLSAMSPRPDSTAYTTSKFALNGLSRSFALDGREQGISVGIIHPGNVASDLLSEEMIQAREYEGFMNSDDVAECVLTMATMPPTTSILELVVMPTTQPFVGRG